MGVANIAAHAYIDVDLERVREIVTDHLPPLLAVVEKELEAPTRRRPRSLRAWRGSESASTVGRR
jgi:uncharacterized protein with HEPN domain